MAKDVNLTGPDRVNEGHVAVRWGDGQEDEGETVRELERLATELTGKEAALFAPSGTMANQLAIHAHTRPGDEIILDVENRRLDVNLPPEEIERRLAAFTPPAPHYHRGYGKLFLDHVTQANLGCDFDFLAGGAVTS